MMRFSQLIGSMVAVVVAINTCGCGPEGRPKVDTVKISGTVKLDGSPLADAQVNFVASEYAGVATTDASGHYEMEAQAGENTVFIRKFDGAVDPDFDETMMDAGDTAGAGPKQLVPEKYSDQEKTELKFTVPESGADAADFDLSA